MADHVIKTGDLIEITISAPAIVPLLEAPIPLTQRKPRSSALIHAAAAQGVGAERSGP